jgi:hypothetical protein
MKKNILFFITILTLTTYGKNKDVFTKTIKGFKSQNEHFTCNNNDRYDISGIATGFKNGTLVILETENEDKSGFISKDTVKVENGKFKFSGTINEPTFHLLQIENVNEKIIFVLEAGVISVIVNKEDPRNSIISGTYNNDEYTKFNALTLNIQKPLRDYQTKNTEAMVTAQNKKNTVVINRLRKEYTAIQEKVALESKIKYAEYASTHPKSIISLYIVDGMVNESQDSLKKAKEMYESLDLSLKNSLKGKSIKAKFTKPKPATTKSHTKK